MTLTEDSYKVYIAGSCVTNMFGLAFALMVLTGVMVITSTSVYAAAIRSASATESKHLRFLRSERFDFNMFGCENCRPVIQCTSDLECQQRYGRHYRCQQTCCVRSVRCVNAYDDDDTEIAAVTHPPETYKNEENTSSEDGSDEKANNQDDDDLYDGGYDE